MAIGRLDKDSEGLLLLTTDGKVSAHITSRKVAKEYLVQVDGRVTEAALTQLRQGVTIRINGQPYQTLPAEVRQLTVPPPLPPRARPVRDDRHGPSDWLSITIREGKFRQVRKMTAAVGHPTLRLIRIRVGKWKLGDFRPGQVVPFVPE